MFYTKRQLEVLDFIRQYLDNNRVSPTLDELAVNFGVSRVTAYQHVQALEKKGVIRRTPNRARSIELVDTSPAPEESILTLPVLGMVEAGSPSVPYEEPEQFEFNQFVTQPGDCHLLKVHGESMIDDHIQEGDLVLVDRKRQPRDGDIVVAAAPHAEGVTLKRIYREHNRVRLQPSNAAMKPMYYDSAEVRGVVVGLIRRM